MRSLEKAVQVGRMLQKKQTGFVHYCYQSEDLKTHDTLPTFENALFALALFRTRLSENVLEGKALIEKILHFEVEGNFPVYLHEYPQLLNPYQGLRLLAPLFWIAEEFACVIGDLQKSLQACIERILNAISTTATLLPSWAQFRIAAYRGEILELPTSIYEIGEALISLQIAKKKGIDAQQALQTLCDFWHPTLKLFTGPMPKRMQEGSYPQLTLFDVVMHEWHKTLPPQATLFHSIYLQAALLYPFIPSVKEQTHPFIKLEKEGEFPIFIAWDKYTFVLAKKNLTLEGSLEELSLYLDQEEEELPINFYLNLAPDHIILVNNQRSTIFQIGDFIEIRSKTLKIMFRLFAEDGQYFGHLLMGNRPGQYLNKGENLFTAYDIRLSLRTLTLGTSPIRLQIRHEIMPQNQELLPLHASHCQHTE